MLLLHRGGVWPGKNHKYFKKHKLNIVFQIFLFNILVQKFHSDIKMLYNYVINNMHEIFRQKEIFFICILAQNVQVLTFAF